MKKTEPGLWEALRNFFTLNWDEGHYGLGVLALLSCFLVCGVLRVGFTEPKPRTPEELHSAHIKAVVEKYRHPKGEKGETK